MLNQVHHSLNELFLQQGLANIAYTIITYLDIQTLYQIINDPINKQKSQYTNIKKYNKPSTSSKNYQFKNIIKTYIFITQYLNKTDRSMYYSFYEQQGFALAENKYIQQLIVNQAIGSQQNDNLSLVRDYDALVKMLSSISNQDELMTQGQIDQLKRIIIDPSLPLPNIKRQNQGIYCNSMFQLFLVGLRFKHNQDSQQQFTLFQQLKQKIISQQQTYLKGFLQIQKRKNQSLKNNQIYKNLHIVRYASYEITYQNYSSLLFQNNQLHNLVVKLFAITDILLQSYVKILTQINDPIYRFIEILTRYSLYRSFVMQIQQSFNFMFQTYDTLYKDAIRDSLYMNNKKIPKFSFWRPAMSKWYIKMSPFHQESNQVYFVLLTKLRQQNLINLLQGDKMKQSQNHKYLNNYAIYLKNEVQIRKFSQVIKNDLQQQVNSFCNNNSFGCGQNPITEFIQQSPQTKEALIFQYVQYLVDLSVNQQTVHWCGHSQHKVEEPFREFNKDFQRYNQRYIDNLKDCIPAKLQEEVRQKLISILIHEEIQFLEFKNVKPVTLRKIVQGINGILIDQEEPDCKEMIITKQQQKLYQKDKITEENNQVIMSTLANAKYPIFFDFTQKDSKLKYFNQKYKILSQIQGEQKIFFSIPPLMSTQQLILKSIDNTGGSSQLLKIKNYNNNDNDDGESIQNDNINSSYEYVSDDQGQEQSTQKNSLHKETLLNCHHIHQKPSIESMLTSITTTSNKDTLYNEKQSSQTGHQKGGLQKYHHNLTLQQIGDKYQIQEQEKKYNYCQEKFSVQSDSVQVQVNLEDDDYDDCLTLKKKLSSSCKNKNF